jgi:hypothetical protein
VPERYRRVQAFLHFDTTLTTYYDRFEGLVAHRWSKDVSDESYRRRLIELLVEFGDYLDRRAVKHN